MPEEKKPGPAESGPAKAAAPAPASRPLVGESPDPTVHKLLGDRQAHTLVLADETSTANDKRVAREATAAIDGELSDLGYQR